ncbi:hypothetical protein [Salinivibrio kushneri]|uniref:hypothetical protein n=1 Tax=Salinivibrio kushneri TaxID=1908198 RepID=UPI0022B47018|nr:hypothetical protein [Salinivibrio kushneri]WBA13441.1 hypothetical protein O4546_13995 [Salinivibrio kushneri]
MPKKNDRDDFLMSKRDKDHLEDIRQGNNGNGDHYSNDIDKQSPSLGNKDGFILQTQATPPKPEKTRKNNKSGH